jgi:hypothetical protein
MVMNIRPILVATLALACNPEEEEEDPAEQACEHAAEAGTAVTAAATREEDASAALEPGEDPVTVTLVEGAEGWLSITSEEDQAGILFAATADVVTALYLDDSENDVLAEAAANASCADDIPEHWDLDRESGTWHLKLGPAVHPRTGATG